MARWTSGPCAQHKRSRGNACEREKAANRFCSSVRFSFTNLTLSPCWRPARPVRSSRTALGVAILGEVSDARRGPGQDSDELERLMGPRDRGRRRRGSPSSTWGRASGPAAPRARSREAGGRCRSHRSKRSRSARRPADAPGACSRFACWWTCPATRISSAWPCLARVALHAWMACRSWRRRAMSPCSRSRRSRGSRC